MPRDRKNPQRFQNGKNAVLSSLNTVNTRCNPLIDVTLEGGEVSFMACDANVFEAMEDESVSSGQYDATHCTHAEMNALANYVDTGNDLSDIDRIEISAPPCKSCAFVLELLGVITKVKTTKNIYKHFTGSWVWPATLQDKSLFNATRWGVINAGFLNSGYPENEVISAVVAVVQSQSSN